MRCASRMVAFAKARQAPQTSEAGFSLVEMIVALTLLALATIGTTSLMASNNDLFFQSSVNGRLIITAQSILDDVQMRYVAGTPKETLTVLTKNEWATFLLQNKIDLSDAAVTFDDMDELDGYRVSSYTAATRTLTAATTSTPATHLPQEGDVFLLGQSKVFCSVQSASQTGTTLSLVLTQGCNPAAVSSATPLNFAGLRVNIELTDSGITISRSRNLHARW